VVKRERKVEAEALLMWRILMAAALAAAVNLELGSARALAQTQKVDLRTKEGVAAVKGQWKYHDVKIVEVPGKGPDGKPNKTYNIEPRAEKPGYDDSQWEVVVPETLRKARSTGQVCFCWYRIKVMIPLQAAGKRVFFQTTVDDYGEIWVDGRLPRTPGKGGEAVVAGFNTPNRVELKDPQPGRVYQIAIFGINGPISAAPSNWIFLGDTFLEIVDKK
jgi:hypothetical protein